MKDVLVGSVGTNVLSVHAAGESRTVDVGLSENGVEVWEETFGPTTMSVHGTPSHINRVVLGTSAAQEAMSLLGNRDGAPAEVLGEFFKTGEKTTLDLMDWLDWSAIPYEAVSSVDGFFL